MMSSNPVPKQGVHCRNRWHVGICRTHCLRATLIGAGVLNVALMAPVAALADTAYVRVEGGRIIAGNLHVELAFRESNGNLIAIFDAERRVNVLNVENNFWSGFALRFLSLGTTQPGDYIAGGNARRFRSGSAEFPAAAQCSL